ncbi:MAG: hypothetical protein ABI395_02935 [Sphingobium sp.]
MTTQSLLELAIAAILFGVGVWLYRRPRGQDPAPDHYGSQGAVLLFAIAAILIVHVVMTERARPAPATVEVNAP